MKFVYFLVLFVELGSLMCLQRIPFFEPYTPPVVGSENFPPFALLLGRANIEIEEECETRQRLQMETNAHINHMNSPLDVVIEEIRIQQRLNNPTNVHHPMVSIVLFCVGSVNPVQNVQRSIGTQEKYIVSGQVFHVAVSLQDHQLRQNGDRLTVD